MENPKGDGQKFKPDFWPKQQEYIQFQDENRITLTLKARQEGFTWLNVYRMLKRCMERENFRVLVFSQAKKQAKEVIRRLYFVYDNLPEAVRMSNPLVGRRNTEILMFKNGSSITSFGTTKDAGRGFAASCVFIDEANKVVSGTFELSISVPMANGTQKQIRVTQGRLNDIPLELRQ
jgi:phage FluMu gp28-like protein